MKEDRIEWNSDKGKYVKKYVLWDKEKKEYYYDTAKGIMITIKEPRMKGEGKKAFFKWANKIVRREWLINILNKIPYVNARMIE